MPEFQFAPYWRWGQPVTAVMPFWTTDLCDACGHARDIHKLIPGTPGIPCKRPGCRCTRPNGYRRCIGPAIAETVTQNGATVAIDQPAPPGTPIHDPR